jgi:NADPH2:quinone reductase
MRAVWVEEFKPFDQVAVATVADPEPGPGEVVVDVVAAEANYPDILVIEGKYQVKPPLPFSPGKAAAGRVAALGSGVENLKLGDRVAVQVEYGAYAEKLRARAESCFPMPEGMGFAEAAALGLVYQTSWFALRERAAFREGESVLVLGASGGIGVASVQLARAMGAKTVIGVVLGPDNVEVARRAGADPAIDASRLEGRDDLRDQVMAATSGRGVDVVIDPVGGELSTACLRTLAWCGRLVVIGFASGDIPAFRANYLLVKNISALGLQWSDYRDREPEKVRRAQEEIYSFFVDGRLAPVISRRVPLARFHEALQALKEGKVQGKVIMDVDQYES